MHRFLGACCGRTSGPDADDNLVPLESTINQLRLSCCSPSWHASACSCVNVLQNVLGTTAHTSIFGASPCGGSLVVLASRSPSACGPLPLGHVMPSPWPQSPSEGPYLTINWQVHGDSAIIRPPPPCQLWADLLPRLHSGTHQDKGGRGGACTRVLFTPLTLGTRLVGALLFTETPPGGGGGTGSGSGPLAATRGRHGGGAGAGTAAAAVARRRNTAYRVDSSASSASASASALIRMSPEVLRRVAVVLVDCLLAPNMDRVLPVCAAAHCLAHAHDIPTIASVLSAFFTDILSTQLHVDELTVRPALVPGPRDLSGGGFAMSYGFMLLERPPSTTVNTGTTTNGGGVGGGGRPPSPPLGLMSPPDEAAAAAALQAQARVHVRKHNSTGTMGSCANCGGATSSEGLFGAGGGGGGGSMGAEREGVDVRRVTTAAVVTPVAGNGGMVPERSGASYTSRGPGRFEARSILLSYLEDDPGGEEPPDDVMVSTPPCGCVGSGSGGHSDGIRWSRKAWKAVPFPLAAALLGGVLRNRTTDDNQSPLGLARGSSGAPSTWRQQQTLRPLARVSLADTAPDLTLRGSCNSRSPARPRTTAVVLSDLHLYLQDVDQPSGDVYLLFGRREGGASRGAVYRAASTTGVGAAWRHPGSSAGTSPTPACLVLAVAGGSVSGAGSYGGMGAGPSLALFITCRERLPSSLLQAMKELSVKLLEMLLPATMEALTEGPAAEELREMSLMMVSRGQQQQQLSPQPAKQRPQQPQQQLKDAADSYNASNSSKKDATTAASAAACGPGALRGFPTSSSSAKALHRILDPGAIPASPSLLNSAASNATVPGVGGAAAPPSSASNSRPLQPQPPHTGQQAPRIPLLKALGRNSLRGKPSASSATGLHSSPNMSEAALPAAHHSASGLVRRMASDLPSASGMSPSTPVSSRLFFASAAASGPTDGMSASANAALPMPVLMRARALALANASGGGSMAGRRSAAQLLDLGSVAGSDMLVPELPNMDVLLTSFYSTLNENTESERSPHAADDLRFLRLTEVLGRGGCSTVYAGRLLGLEVAVKVLEPLPSAEDPNPNGGGGGGCDVKPPGDAMQGGGGGRTDGGQQQKARTSAPAEAAGGQEAVEGCGSGRLPPAPPQERPWWAVARQARLRDLMRGVRELAVLSSISHPNIVQVYSYHTNVRVLPPARPGGLPKLAPRVAVTGSEGHPQPENDDQPQVAIIMECCDLGSLADALDSGRFKEAVRLAASAACGSVSSLRRATSGLDRPVQALLHSVEAAGGGQGVGVGVARLNSQRTGGVAMRAIYLTLLEVALALRHLHSKNLVHCDVKAANVMLKSSASDPRGFTCKLGDFGLVHVVRKEVCDVAAQQQQQQGPAAPPQEGPVGTVTHLAPEYFTPGTKVDFSADIYAFGILMWEVFTSQPPFAEFAAQEFQALPAFVVHEGLRPRWPAHVPSAYRSLACACWSGDPPERPAAAAVVASLQQLMEG